MKPRKETVIENTFNVDTLISLWHDIRLGKGPVDKNNIQAGNVVYDNWQLLYMEQGTYTCQLGEQLYTLQAGQLLICEPGKVRMSFHYQDERVGIVNIRCSSPKMDAIKNRIFTLSPEEKRSLLWILSFGTETFQVLPSQNPYRGQQPLEGTPDYKLQLLKNHLEILLISLYERCHTSPDSDSPEDSLSYYDRQFRIIEHYMKQHLTEMLTVDQLSQHTGFSPSTIKRIFSYQTGCGAIHYFLMLKMLEAQRLIRETNQTMTEIAETLGFSSIHYFSRLFKKLTGISPRQYADQLPSL